MAFESSKAGLGSKDLAAWLEEFLWPANRPVSVVRQGAYAIFIFIITIIIIIVIIFIFTIVITSIIIISRTSGSLCNHPHPLSPIPSLQEGMSRLSCSMLGLLEGDTPKEGEPSPLASVDAADAHKV